MDIDIHQLPTMTQQAWPGRRKPTVKRFDGNVNLTDATFTAFHVSLFALWPSAFPSRRALWKPRTWRFKGRNVDPGGLQGGLAETITIDKYADPRSTAIAACWRDRIRWRNRPYVSDRVEEIQHIPLLFPSWMWLRGPQHKGKWARRKAQRKLIAVIGSQQSLVQTEVDATTSAPLGDIQYTGGSIVGT